MDLGIIPFIIVFLIGTLNVYYNTRASNLLFFISLFALGALRYNVGFDYPAYVHLITSGESYEINRIEPIEKHLILQSRVLFTQLFFIVNTLITVLCIKKSLEKLSCNIAISCLAFLCFPLLFTYSFSIVRFWTALSIIFYASTFLVERKWKQYIILSLIALGFHNAAICSFLYIPLIFFRISLVYNFIILLFGIFGGQIAFAAINSGILPNNIYTDILIRYSNSDSIDALSKIPYLYLAIDIIVLLCAKKFNQINPQYYQYISIFNIGVSLMFLFQFQATFAERLSMPFLLYLLNIIPIIIFNPQILKIKISVNAFKMIFILICGSLFFYTITIYNSALDRSQYLPYRLFFLE